MRKKKDEVIETEELEEVELTEKELKKQKQKENVEKRKNAKKKDKVARWGGIILLGLIMFVGFLLLVFGEMSAENSNSIDDPSTSYPTPTNSSVNRPGTIIVK